MSLCTIPVDCGPLGEVELTISYSRSAARRQTDCEPGEPESVSIRWIKIGGANGVCFYVADDYLADEIIPACIADWHGEQEAAAEARADELREERLMMREAA